MMTSVQLIISRAAFLIIVIILNIKLKRKTKKMNCQHQCLHGSIVYCKASLVISYGPHDVK